MTLITSCIRTCNSQSIGMALLLVAKSGCYLTKGSLVGKSCLQLCASSFHGKLVCCNFEFALVGRRDIHPTNCNRAITSAVIDLSPQCLLNSPYLPLDELLSAVNFSRNATS